MCPLSMLILLLTINADVSTLKCSIIIEIRKNVTPCLKVLSKTFGTLEKVHLEYLRLGLPVICKDEFVVRYVSAYRE